jgi:orotate phosphoribosyltransferase
MTPDRERLRALIDQRCLIDGPEFTLSTGEKSRFYFDCKGVTLDAEGLTLIAEAFVEEISRLSPAPDAIGGMTMGADFMVAATLILSRQRGGTLRAGSIVRKEPKKHGTRNKVENQLPSGTRVVVVEDVITSGGSTQRACTELEDAGYEVVGILAVVDREAGGIQALQSRYPSIPVRALFTKSEFPRLAASITADAAKRAIA